jgi:hypothetical protein
MSKQVTSRLSQLSEKPFTKNPCQEDRIRLKVDEQMFSDCIEHHVEAVDASIPDPNQCSFEQLVDGELFENQNTIYATNGQVLEFFVCIKNSFGDNLRFMEDRIEVKLNGSRIELDCLGQNFTCGFIYEYKVQPYKLYVMIDGQNIQKSPTNIFGHRTVTASKLRGKNSRKKHQFASTAAVPTRQPEFQRPNPEDWPQQEDEYDDY